MPLSPRTFRPASTGFTPRSISGLALWLDAADSSTTYTTDAGPVTAVTAPTDIAGCALWLDGADSSASSMALNGSLVETWKDKTSNGRDFTATSTARPTLTGSAINARSVVTFNGSSNTMTGNAAAQDVIRNLAGYTVFTVLRTTTVAAGERLAFGVGATVLFRAGQTDSRSFIGGRRVGGDTLESVTGTAGELTANAAFIQSAVVNHTAQSLTGLRNGTAYGTDTTYMAAGVSENVASSVSVGTQAGGTYGFWNGDIAEVVVYNTAISTADRARVEAYLATKWGISGVHAPATATSDPVGYWADKSGNARHATQATGASRLTVSGTALNNRKQLGLASQHLRGPSLSWNGSVTAYWVGRTGQASSGAVVFHDGSVADQTDAFHCGWLNAQGVGAYGNGWGSGNAPRAESPSAWRSADIVAGVTLSGTESLARVNGATVNTVAGLTGTLSQSTPGSFYIGREASGTWTNLNGTLAELLIYQPALSASQRQRVERYLAAKWGITLAPQVSNADAQDWINRVYANGGTVSSSTAAAVNQFCNDIDAVSGLRACFYRLNPHCGGVSQTTAGLNAALVPLYRGPSLGGTHGSATDANNAFSATDYNETGATGGLLGNGTTKYLNTGLAPSNLPSYTSAHIAVYHSQPSGTNQTRAWIACRDTSTASSVYLSNGMFSTSAVFGQYMANATANFNTGGSQTGAAGGFRVLSRTAADRLDNYYNAVSQANSTLSISGGIVGVTSAQPFFIFANNNQGTADSLINSRIMAYSIGLGLSQSQVDAYNAAMLALQTALNRNV